MVYDRDPDQDLSNRPPPAKHTRWELSTLVIGLIVILTRLSPSAHSGWRDRLARFDRT